MKNLNHFKIKTVVVLVNMLIASALQAEVNNAGITAKPSVETTKVIKMTIENDISVYQFALKNKMTVNEFIAINDNRFNASDLLKKGMTVNTPQTDSNNPNLSIEETNTTLPELGASNLPSDPNEVISMASSVLPGEEYVLGTAEENLANIAKTTAQEDWKNFNSEQIIDEAKQQGIDKIKNTVNSQVNKAAESFLGLFGKAEVNIAIDEDGEVTNSQFNVLSPWFDKNESLLFSQVGVHEQGSGQDSRVVGNFGIGYRYETNDWLAGANAFIDHDFTGANTRLGLGAELWADNYKLAANTYAPISGWKESDIMKNHEALIYDERPAKGFDIRAKSYLPNYPQLGGSLVYEQYFGDEVALFGINERQSDPYSFGLGIDYILNGNQDAGFST